jgi:hypothetical protein
VSAEHHQADPVEGVGHERRDVNVAAVALFIVSLELLMLACCGLGLAFHKGYLHWMQISGASISALGVYVQEPPVPRLQEDPTGDFEKYKESEAALVTSYGWVDAHHGTVRLPVERAKELIAARGLPARETKS